ncbi:unnamed protein product [Chironomus riparius]|uniref:Insulin receptor substrate 1 n=1 Tax=Chironomus riparius TaxID=315576 RepID=A0A9P0NBA9_9DIPT|nr:unnamed protein product [Chironomus riparius]
MSNTNPNYGHSKILSNLIHAMNHSSSSNAMTSSSAGNGASMVACSSSSCDRQSPLLQGYLYKIHKRNGKTQKYFVIFDDVPDKPGTGRLEYFDSEKKFKSAMAKSKTGGITNEKRSIILCTCFNINRRFDTKYRNVIGLYRKDDTFSIMAKDESECNSWLKQMLILQRGKESVDADQPRPTFEHVWEVDIIRRGLGDSYGIVGPYRVCITDTTLSLVRIGPPTTSVGTNRPDKVDFALAHMRRCGSTQSVFYLEVGRFTSTGAGEIWMETYDPMIAENMNTIILNTAQKKANSHRTEENLGPMMRIRSQSANETSKPLNHRRSTLTGKPNFSPSELPDSTESSATSTGTIILNQNALKPKNNQTHSVSQMSLQSTGIATSAASLNKCHNTSNVVVDKTNNKCNVIQCSYPTSCNKEQQQPSSQPSTSNSSISISTITANNVMSTSSPSSSMIYHQRALSLPQNSNSILAVNANQTAQTSSNNSNSFNISNNKGNNNSNNNNNNKGFAIQPVHHRTRSLPLTEETAIDFTSQSPPNFTKYSSLHSTTITVTSPTPTTSSSLSSSYTSSGVIIESKQNNNSMESIIEDYQNMDVVNNNSYRSNNGGSSILKQLSKIANSNFSSHNSNASSSPSQLRKKRQHHNVMTASLRSSSASTRERCDSFPLTRIRTTSDTTPTHSQTPQQNGNYANNNNNTINNNISMPPPRRPVSMSYASQRYGNSPPNNSSPISPPSCSESDASSASIDETDGFIHSMTLEEHGNLRDYQKKESPIPPHEAYVDMHPYSPYSCSPGDPPHNAYMPMSPGDYRTGMYVNSGAHSRASSLAEDNEGYVPMHPATNHDSYLQMSQPEDYMNMQPANNQMSIHGGELSSATSSCSITSGTPSTDIRFSEYHLDKVQARFTPSEDDELLDRPPRTYSVGSKLEHTKRKLHIDRVAAEHSNLRHRAYSVGSRNIKVSRAELTSHSGSHTPSSHNSPVAMNHHEINNNTSGNNNNNNAKNKKSSSAPLLANVLGKTGHGSFEQMDDLMEIDFSSQSSGSSLTRVNTSSTPIKSSPVNIPSKPNDNYMNMSGRQSNKSSCSAGISPYVDMKPTASRRVSENNDYMDMNPASSTTLRTSNTSTSLSSSPLKALTTPTASAPRSVPATSNTTGSTNNNNSNNNNSNYMDMSPRSYDISSRNNHRNTRMTSSVTSLSSQKLSSDDYLNMSPVNKSLPDVDLPKRSSVPDGYMEMSWTKTNKKNQAAATRNNANDNPSSSSDEYINMDYSNNNDGAGTSDSSSSAKDRSISLPITINKRYSNSSRSQKSSKSGSIENGPPAFLPLTGTNQITASVSPTRSTNISRTRCDSRDSGIVGTPSGSQATIFPFSPGSPMKQFDPIDDSNLPRKCLVDGSTGTIKLSEDDIIEEEPRTPVPMGMTSNNSEKQLDTLSNDYAVMNLGEPVSKKPNLAATPVQIKSSSSLSANATSHFLASPDSENHDYINCMPSAHINSSQKIVTPTPIIPQHNNNNNNSVEAGDYALMNPVKAASSPIAKQAQQQCDSDIPPVTSSKKSLLLTISSHEKLNTSNSCFKPIVEDSDSNSMRNHPLLQRHVSEKGHRSSNDTGYEILSRPSLSRPNSVNSEKIKCSTSGFLSNRPNSANSERLALSSTSSSTSTLCEIQSQCSSSSTLKNIMMDTTSGVPSPMSIISRPESVSSDVHMTSRPPSVTSERELHYASLDLPPCSNTNLIHLAQQQKMDVDETSGTKMDFTTSSSPQTSSSSSSSASSQQSQPAFTYAQIDFVKSESLKAQQQQTNNNSNNNNQSGSKK